MKRAPPRRQERRRSHRQAGPPPSARPSRKSRPARPPSGPRRRRPRGRRPPRRADGPSTHASLTHANLRHPSRMPCHAPSNRKGQVRRYLAWPFSELPSGFEPTTYALQDRERSCRRGPGGAVLCHSAWSGWAYRARPYSPVPTGPRASALPSRSPRQSRTAGLYGCHWRDAVDATRFSSGHSLGRAHGGGVFGTAVRRMRW